MGKRKSTAIKPKPSRVPKLDKEFDCPFCSHSKAVKVELDRVRGIGALSCRVCGAMYNRAITRLDEGIDVYGDWIDACVSANAEAAKDAQLKLEKGPAVHGGPPRGAPTGVPESASDGETAARRREKRERFALSGGPRVGPRMGLKKLSRQAESEGEGSSSEEPEGVPGAAPEREKETTSRKRLKVDKDREDEEAGAAVESDGSDPEAQKQANRDTEVGGVLEHYRREAEGEEEGEDEDTALFHDDE